MVERYRPQGLFSFTIEGVMHAAKLARGCYKKKNTRPDSGDCRNVTSNMIDYGVDQFVYMGRLPRKEDAFATAPHCCARLVEDGRIFAVDPQYLQFVPPEERNGLPELMIISANDEDMLIEGLCCHHIPDNKHHLWINLFFTEES